MSRVRTFAGLPARPLAILVIVVLSALVTLGIVGASVLARDRDAMYERFARDRLHSLDELARSLENDVVDIGEDLELAATLLGTANSNPAAERELHAIATIKREYLVVEARNGATTTRVVAPDAAAGTLERSDHALRDTLDRAERSPGTLEVSGPLSQRGDAASWYRVYARRAPQGPAVATVVDTTLLLGRLKMLRDKSSLLLVVGTDGATSPLSDPRLAASVRERGLTLDLVTSSDTQQRWTTLDASDASALGLPETAAVAIAVPFSIDRGTRWRLVLVTSNAVLQTQERTLIRRLAVGSVLALALLLAAAGYVVYTVRRAAALQERLRQADQLAHLTDKADKILDHIPSGVLALSADQRISATNRWFEQRFGRDVIGRNLREVFAEAPAEDVQALIDLVGLATSAHAPRSLHRTTFALLGADTVLSVHAIPLERSLPDVHLLVVFEDLTPLRRVEERLLRSEKLATAGQLAAGIAHEIGTPLNIARGRAELARSRLGDHPQAASQEVIIDQIDRVSRLIQQLLDIARPSRAIAQDVDPAAALQAITELLSAQAEQRQLELRATVAPSLPKLRADPDQLQQVLLNLVVNAMDACKPGGHVELRALPGDGSVVLEVADDGHGIKSEIQGQIFDPFFTTRKRGQGTGLGLWVVAQVVRTHAGEIELRSEPDVGTTVRMTWPVANRRPAA
jgi:two-component system, NtrC family, sensor histidine kinase HydH